MKKIINEVENKIINFKKVEFLIEKYRECVKEIFSKNKKIVDYFTSESQIKNREELLKEYKEFFSDTQIKYEFEDRIKINVEKIIYEIFSIQQEDEEDKNFKLNKNIVRVYLIVLNLIEKTLQKYGVEVYWLYQKIYFIHTKIGKFCEIEVKSPSDVKIRFI